MTHDVTFGVPIRLTGEPIAFAVHQADFLRTADGRSVTVAFARLACEPGGDTDRALPDLPVLTIGDTLRLFQDDVEYIVRSIRINLTATAVSGSVVAADALTAQRLDDDARDARELIRRQMLLIPKVEQTLE